MQQRFGLGRVMFVGDRGLLTAARVREDLEPVPGLSWITALRTPEIRKLGALTIARCYLVFDAKQLASTSQKHHFRYVEAGAFE